MNRWLTCTPAGTTNRPCRSRELAERRARLAGGRVGERHVGEGGEGDLRQRRVVGEVGLAAAGEIDTLGGAGENAAGGAGEDRPVGLPFEGGEGEGAARRRHRQPHPQAVVEHELVARQADTESRQRQQRAVEVPAQAGVDRRPLVGEALAQARGVELEGDRVERRRMRAVEIEVRPARVVGDRRVAQDAGNPTARRACYAPGPWPIRSCPPRRNPRRWCR